MSDFASRLSSYSLAQLNELLGDDEKLYKIVTEQDEVQQVQKAKEVALAGNRSLAQHNLLLQPTLDSKKNELSKRYRQLQDIFEAYQRRRSALDQSSGSNSIETMLALLQAEGAKIEEETENMAESFLDGSVPLDTFIDTYQSKRELMHVRRVKIEKLRETVLRGRGVTRSSSACAGSPGVQPQHTDSARPPTPLPRRAPPPPPMQIVAAAAPTPAPVPAAPTPMGASYPVLPFPVSLYPHIPPGAGRNMSIQNRGYPSAMYPQCPPHLPQRPPPRVIPQPSFIIHCSSNNPF